ncbi:MAG: TonB-dependent receptor [Acidobacteria bacterium]|nr:TonB-dependent receptor [Acidobacteriota bacterium]
MNRPLAATWRGFGLSLALLAVLGAATATEAQDFRGAIAGRITDRSGGVLPGTTVTATNVATNVGSTTTTNTDGIYSLLYLTPGTYTVVAELPGFKKLSREGIEVRVGDRIALDLSLEVGQLEETVSVTAESPLLELSSGSAGQVIDEKRISMMPLSDGNPFVLARLVPGIAYTGDLKFSRPFDNAGTSSVTADGSSGGNEFTLDGSPNMASGRRVAFVPPAGAVQEFKVETASFDAADGHTAGARINVTLKSGTNSLKGETYYYKRDDRLSATDFFLLKSGGTKPPLSYDRFGGHVGGPVRIPGMYDGHDRTFFFGALEWLYDEFPEPGPRTVPTEAMRNGDFSALVPLGIAIYDPASARIESGRVVRTPFGNNVIPTPRLNAIAREVLRYYPLPNQPGDAQGRNNYFSVNPRADDFYSISTRVDHRISDRQQLFVRFTRNNRRESRGAFFGLVNGVTPVGNFLFRINDGITADHVYTMSAGSLLNVRGGWQRFREPSVRQHEGLFDPATLGFSSSVVQSFAGARYFPRFDFDSLTDIGDNLASTTVHSIYSFQPTLTRIAGRHSLRAGYDARLYKEFSQNLGRQAGEYLLRNGSAFTRAQDNSAGLFGQDVATFLLGLPTGGSIDRNGTRLNSTFYQGFFLQDDWKVSDRLTLNLGVRYELEAATKEAKNRNVRGFDPAAAVSIEAAARAAYARNPIPELAPSAFNVRGGLQFASDANRGFWNTDKNNVQPRIGFAYQLNSRTVVRGGWGLYTIPLIISGNFQPGFSQSTPLVASLDNGLTFRSTLANPFPDGVLDPSGASGGADTFLGQDLNNAAGSRFVPLDYHNGQNMRYLVTVQRELPGQWLVEAGYAGSHGYDMTTGGGGQIGEIDLNAVPARYLSTSRERDLATINFLTALVPNPFRRLLPPTGFNGATIARQQLLKPFPQFGNLRTFDDDGSSRYNSAQVKVERRFTRGHSVLVAYTWSKFTERVFKLNPTDTEYEERLSEFDVPHRFVISGILELPFGRGRHWGRNSGGLADALLGGWSVQAIGQLQSGRPISFHDRNIYFNGDLSKLETNYSGDTNQPVFDISGFYFHDAPVQTSGVDDPNRQRADQRIRLANNLRYFPSRIPGLRGHGLNLWDISVVKQVRVTDRVRAQIHVEFLNAFNHPIYNNPNTDPTNAEFGKVTSQGNLPRDIQLAAKIIF